MKKIVLTYGLLSGVVIFVLVWLIASLCEKSVIDLDKAQLVGYGSMIIALAMVFFGIKSYRDNYGNGKITFWKGVQIGLLISLIGGLMYFLGGETYNYTHPGFQETFVAKYVDYTSSKMKASGASQEEVEKTVDDMKKTVKMLENPLIYFAVSLMEILPVGIIVTLISAALLRKKEILPATA
ncbi:MAG TPA: DUF4199 domain-containing protein [Pyrinomonadaceae bacterium]|nr:DUF4199 domain-containing protein [Pyrinomonadaceae bacterium]